MLFYRSKLVSYSSKNYCQNVLITIYYTSSICLTNVHATTTKKERKKNRLHKCSGRKIPDLAEVGIALNVFSSRGAQHFSLEASFFSWWSVWSPPLAYARARNTVRPVASFDRIPGKKQRVMTAHLLSSPLRVYFCSFAALVPSRSRNPSSAHGSSLARASRLRRGALNSKRGGKKPF